MFAVFKGDKQVSKAHPHILTALIEGMKHGAAGYSSRYGIFVLPPYKLKPV